MPTPGEGPRLLVKRLDPQLPLPAYAHPGDAGLDLYAAQDATLGPGQRGLVGTGVAVAIPEGYVGLTTPRSGLAVRHGLSMVNAPGVIDSGYRGEIKLILVNLDPREPIAIGRGDRVAQLLIVPLAATELMEVDELPFSTRGEGGFGSTGA